MSILTLSACGAEGKASAAGDVKGGAVPALTGAANCGATSGKPATGTPIKVGAVVGATGPADFTSASKGAKAYFDCVNANGGINGRPVEYLVKDDGWDPGKASQAARQLVEDEGVVAMVGSTSFVECGANAAYYEKNNVLVIAGVGVPRECFHSRNIAPTNQGPRLSGIGAAQLAKADGAKSIACVANVIPNFGGWVCQGLNAWGKAQGVKIETFLGKPDASDAAAITLKAIRSKTDAVVLVDAAPSMAAYLKAAQQQKAGAAQPWYLPTSGYNTSFPGAIGKYWNGKLKMQIELNTFDSTGADNAAWKGVMAQYGGDAPRDSFSQAGFLAAKIFTDTLRTVRGEITRESVSTAIRAITNYRTDLLCGPWYFGDAAEHNANHAGRAVTITGSAPTGFQNLKDCYQVQDPDLAAIRRAEKS
jgi:branched-chain amino acid transport system substrate-binding protein